ncbi:MAG: envelope stress response membrane protein PspB [Rhodospirillales bacterium]|jgi:phage shock protein B|nr:envelope stress response membrane protein PspB [Rhodospirillaceae bacterium]MDP6426482.1 envelope stress response membrane protein PspB [Rhodospirillales bacterium]MDP6643015.1 envelope stress response membrane protein PspB [Rhodospirillales bacterium]MDP6842159.1 envelope stress response membrane protein PspB [Rhodospirillales bacterium]|tara:strand:- start:1574 stop:1804 length:231 start_codon:yes stop_codon:yes gene_type:complete
MSGIAFMPLAVLFMVVVLPIWIIAHYGTRWRSNRAISSGDEQLLAELWDAAGKMEDRLATLERILDEEAPDWRTRS